MFSLLHYYYGMPPWDVRRLTVKQYIDRIRDIKEIEKLMGGEGRGRIKRNEQVIREAMNKGIIHKRFGMI